MDQKIINLYDAYTHSQLSRAAFMKKLAVLVGGTAMALTVLPLLESNYAMASTFSDDDVWSENITFPGVEGDMKGILVIPKGKKKMGAVIVIHENRGLTPHIIDVTKRVALAGFMALGVDALSPFGGTPTEEDKGRELIGNWMPLKIYKTIFKSVGICP